MKKGTILKHVKLNQETTINLDKIYPIQPIDHTLYDVTYYIDDEIQEINFGSYYVNKIVVSSTKEKEVTILLGGGYLTEFSKEWTDRFITEDIWQGGDGIFTFNLDNGNDQFDQEEKPSTLMVFGDSFIGRFDPSTQQRLDPHSMPNNTIAYFNKNQLEFKVNRGESGEIKAFYEVSDDFNYKGPLPNNLESYHLVEELEGFLSAYNPTSIELVFDLHKPRYISHLSVYNYFSTQSVELAKRGMKDLVLYGSNDLETFEVIKEVSLQMATSLDFFEQIRISKEYRYFKFVCDTVNGVGNHNDSSYQEGLFGLNKVKFFDNDRQYIDVSVTSNTFLIKEHLHAWIWLQDGVVIGNHLYFLPLTVTSDHTQPEGLQFKVLGVSLFKTPIKDGLLDTTKSTQKLSPLYATTKESSYFFGAGIMANTLQAGAMNPDGYVYVYGYKTTYGLREMLVARVKAENFEYFDEWTYFDGSSWSRNILDSKPLLQNISCEMSVSPILEGRFKGKYIAVFTYNVDTKHVAFSIGETPFGPFTKAQKVYETKEKEIFKETTYTYNAKAHPHLSNSKRILVSYNTNTYNFEHNMSNRLIYGPRFIYLNEIEE